jgi:hypothetical protein
MSNNSRVNPFYVDGTGGLVNPNTEIMVSGILVTPSNATWAIIIKDGAGNTKFSSNNVGNLGGMPPCVPFKSTGFEVTTLTNCTALIYLTP